MFHNNVVFVLIVLCTIVQSGVAAPNRNFQVVKNNGYELDCSQFHSDYDVLRQFPFPVVINPTTHEDYEKSTAVMVENGTFVKSFTLHFENVVPSSIFCLSNLEILNIRTTPFENGIVPDSLANLKKLRELYIFHSNIKRMTEQLGTLTSLETMMLLNCSITYLPNLSNLQQLRILEVPMNQLTHLDGIPGVENLALDINVFSEIPILEKRENLRGLSMIDNRLKSFAPILLYKNLEAIFISNTSMSLIPPAFDQLRNLTYLDVGKNPLSYFPENLFNLPKLEFLNLRKTLISPNDIQSIQKTFAKSHPSIQILI